MSQQLEEGQQRGRLPSGDDLDAHKYTPYLSLTLHEAIDQLISQKEENKQL